MLRRVWFVGLAAGTAVFVLMVLIINLQPVQAASETIVLYDGALGGTPDTQAFGYRAFDQFNFPTFEAEATQTYSSALAATILDTTPDINEYAGYALSTTQPITFDRSTGFQLDLRLRIASETHDGGNDRAGFSIVFLAEDTQGIEISFWEDRIWAQEGGSADLFTPAEGVDFDTTADFVDYTLTLITDTYTLAADGAPILSGPLRDYSAWTPPLPIVPDIYEQPNLLALSDNTTSAQGETWLAYAAVTTDLLTPLPPPVIDLTPAGLTVSETVGTAVFTVQLDAASAETVTVDVSTITGTAVAGIDYMPIAYTLTFTPTVVSQTVAVPILNNNVGNLLPRQFQVQLTNPAGGQLGNSTAQVTILDDDMNQFVYLPILVRDP